MSTTTLVKELVESGVQFGHRSSRWNPKMRPYSYARRNLIHIIDVRETMLAIRMEFASFDDYWTPYLGKDGPGPQYMATLSPAQHDRLRDAVRAAYIDGDPDGPRSYVAVAWAVAGTVPG